MLNDPNYHHHSSALVCAIRTKIKNWKRCLVGARVGAVIESSNTVWGVVGEDCQWRSGIV